MKTAPASARSCAKATSGPAVVPVLRRLALLLARCLRLDRQRVDRALEFRLQGRIHHAVTFDPALPFEGRRYDIDPEMRLAARPVAGMALMQMRFVRNVEAFGHESFTQLVYDSVPGAHDGGRYVYARCS